MSLHQPVVPAAFEFGGDEAVAGIDGIVLPTGKVGLIARLGQGELNLTASFAAIGLAYLDQPKGGGDSQRCQESQGFGCHRTVHSKAAERDAAVGSVIEMGSPAIIPHAVPVRSGVRDVQPPAAVATSDQPGQQ